MNGAFDLYPLAIIILNWNLPVDTIACVHTVRKGLENLAGASKIVLVDNGSTDDSVARFEAELGSLVQIVQTPKNLGFAGGMNVGIRWALEQGANAVLLLNNDTVVDPAMIRTLLTVAEQQPQASVVGPAIYYFAAPTQLWQAGDRSYPWSPIPFSVSAQDLTAAGGVPFRVDYITGCCMLIPRAIVETVGLFDERFFMYFEDADLCRRMRDAGFAIWCAPAAKMWHKVSLSAHKDRPGQRYWRTWGKVQFYKQHPHGPLAALAHVYLWAKTLLSSVGDLWAGDWHLLAPLWQGMIAGYLGRHVNAKLYFRK